MDIQKIDDNTISVSNPVVISDIKAKIDSLTTDNQTDQNSIINLQRLIDDRSSVIKNLQSQIDQAATLGVADAVPLATGYVAPTPDPVQPVQ